MVQLTRRFFWVVLGLFLLMVACSSTHVYLSGPETKLEDSIKILRTLELKVVGIDTLESGAHRIYYK